MDMFSRFSTLVERSHQGLRIEQRLQRLILRTAVHVLRNSSYVTDWYPLLDDPLMHGVLEAHPRVCEKISRPYLRCGLSRGDRHRLLIGHYHWLRAHLSDQAFVSIYMGEGLELARLLLGDIGEYRLVLHYLGQFEMEGDMTLSLIRTDGLRIHSATFSMLQVDQELHIQIGGMQGGVREFGEAIKLLTKALHGMRPKALVLWALMQLASAWGSHRLLGIRSANHVYRCLSFNRSRKERIWADYDSLWQEAGGIIASDNTRLYELPLAWPLKPLETVPANKRATYRRRYAMFEVLAKELEVRASAALSEQCISVLPHYSSQSQSEPPQPIPHPQPGYHSEPYQPGP